ncbi:MAG: hypothetical protein IT463_00655 [Planctomycetes bacterium]|nr:hypothetical protein [Planctomycetota bacterium]
MSRNRIERMAVPQATDANDEHVGLGDRVVDLNSGTECVVLDLCPELGPESVYVQLVHDGGPSMDYWVEPGHLMKLPRFAA